MSKKHDQLSTIKLDSDLEKRLNNLRKKSAIKVSLASVTNAAIRLGLPTLEKTNGMVLIPPWEIGICSQHGKRKRNI